MKEMELLANQYAKEHRGLGRVSNVTEYSFKFTLLPKKTDKTPPKSYIVMKSYFWKP